MATKRVEAPPNPEIAAAAAQVQGWRTRIQKVHDEAIQAASVPALRVQVAANTDLLGELLTEIESLRAELALHRGQS